ncbi:MAG: hypothetical protein V1874_06490 [Spirochaetota bacterium]
MLTDNLLKDTLSLKPVEKADLIDKLLTSLDKPNKKIDNSTHVVGCLNRGWKGWRQAQMDIRAKILSNHLNHYNLRFTFLTD